MRHGGFDEKSARRIAKVVRKSERESMPSRGGPRKRINWQGGLAGALDIRVVAKLPAIPVSGVQIVLWGDTSLIDGGTGDNSYWIAHEADEEWSPFVYCTALTGAPDDE